MDTDKDTVAPAAAPPESAGEAPQGPDARVRWRRETLVPTLAAVVVAVTAVITTVVVTRNGSPPLAVEQAPDTSVSEKAVVTAPPLKPAPQAPAKMRTGVHAMGASAACRNCGVVQMVVAVHDYRQPKPSAYQMHIRMDDGTTRTVEQRGALAAGSRVVVEGKSVRALAAPLPGQG